ncbi:putative disease resistance protein RGA1 [Magnolia sinica]|uniref:putative disease resistance protein RGA1 n=1 Tax=Magnolia sinica TaxID=86752 RepID=UPI002658E8C3|nr:putative disease resistance protein RGA1 [Magnolia sinica]
MAEGFIQPSDGTKQMEDIGGEYFNNLQWWYFIQDAKKDDDGNIVWCRMHDLVHDLARSVAGIECSIMQAGGEYFNNLLWRYFIQDAKKDDDGNIVWCRMHDLVHDLARSVAGIECSIMQVDSAVTIPNIYHRLSLECGYSRWVLTVPKASRKANHLRTLFLLGRHTFSIPRNLLDSGRGIRELQSLDLRGELVIRNLENARCAIDAQEAKLKEKPNRSVLGFSWGHDIDVKLRESVKQTLEGLRPHPNLKKLVVEEYVGVQMPHWMSSWLLPNLVELSLINCKRCEELPQLGQLSFLLVIQGMDAVKSIGNHFYGDEVTEGFPSLKVLIFKDLPNLEEWSGFNGREVLPHLDKLTVWRCPKLIMLPCLPSLKELQLMDSDEMLLGSMGNLTSLSSLLIESFEELKLLPDGLLQNHTRLSMLSIRRCPKLESLSGELGNLAALESLTISYCRELLLLPMELQNLASLRSLWIEGCNGLTSLRLHGLSSLQRLTIFDC